LKKWENEHPNYSVLHSEYQQLHQHLSNVHQVLKNAKRRLKDARACAMAVADEKAKGDITDLMWMPAIDKGWTAKWLSEFCSSQIASPNNLPCLGELMEFIESGLPVKIAIPPLILRNG